MFGHRTPAKRGNRRVASTASPEDNGVAAPTDASRVRRSIGEWEAARPDPTPRPQTVAASPVDPPQAKPKTLSQGSKSTARRVSAGAMASPPERPTYGSRAIEAKACFTRAKLQLGSARNLKTDIKEEVSKAVERLYALVKEAEVERLNEKEKREEMEDQAAGKTTEVNSRPASQKVDGEAAHSAVLLKKMEEHSRVLEENSQKLDCIRGLLVRHGQVLEGTTYASAVIGKAKRPVPEPVTLHSVVVASSDESETGDEVLTHVREAIDAKDGWVRVERVRKAKDSKVIIGCSTEEDRAKVKQRLKSRKGGLLVEDVKNKDPLVILRDVLRYNSDEDIKTALRNQNRGVFDGLDKEQIRMEICFRKMARNQLTSHVVMRVSPPLWRRMTEAEAVHVDLQKVAVADHSPLVQCSLCLGYGHGRRFCTETEVKCSHCGGPHLKGECDKWRANEIPVCINCNRAGLEATEHCAFSQQCPVRSRWDALARATVAYC